MYHGIRPMLSILEIMTMMTMQIFSDAMFDEIMFSTYFDKCALYQLELVIWSDRQSDVTCQTKICENSPLPVLFSLLAWNLLLLFTSTLYSLSLYDRASYSAKSGRQQRPLHAMHWPEIQNWFLPRMGGIVQKPLPWCDYVAIRCPEKKKFAKGKIEIQGRR